MRAAVANPGAAETPKFPFLFGGTFIEGDGDTWVMDDVYRDFPSFSEGLSLRVTQVTLPPEISLFPFLFGGTFIEGIVFVDGCEKDPRFPFLFGGTFIEGRITIREASSTEAISLPFRRDFH